MLCHLNWSVKGATMSDDAGTAVQVGTGPDRPGHALP